MVGRLYLPLVLMAAVVGMGFALFSWLNRDRPGAKPLTLFLMAGSFWAVAEGLTIAEGGLSGMLFWAKVALTLSFVPPLTWLLLVLEYTGKEQWLNRWRLGALLVEPAVFVALVWQESALVWTDIQLAPVGRFRSIGFESGIAFWGHQVYVSLLLVAGVVMLVRLFVRTGRFYRWQSTALLAGITIPIVANAIYLVPVLPPGLDPTGVAYVLGGSILAVGLLDTDLLSIAPVTRDMGRQAILSELDDAMVILDSSNRIVDVNPAAEALLGPESDILGEPLSTVEPSLADAMVATTGRADVQLDVDGKLRYYDLSISPLGPEYGGLSGNVVSLRDVTERRQQDQRLDVLNRLLRHNIRNELNLVRGKIELTRARLEDGEGDELSDAISTVDDIVARSNKVGRLSRLLEAEEADTLDIAQELRAEYTDDGYSEIATLVSLELPETLVVRGGESLMAAFEELVTNAVEHNDSETPQVTVRVDEARSDDTHAVIAIADNGPGIDQQEIETLGEKRETPLQHSSGVGLWLVHWLVRRAGGELSFESADDGSTVRVHLPRAGPPADSDTQSGNAQTTDEHPQPDSESTVSEDDAAEPSVGER